MPSIHGEDAVLRILDKESLHEKFHQLRLDILGFADRELRRVRRFIREPYGMVLVTGPTGSGKTTTLYAALSEIKSEEDKIITIEDPVEYQIRGITQIPVNEKKGLTFARGLRSILRHDPDKIMVGEIRDNETAQNDASVPAAKHVAGPGNRTRLVAGGPKRGVHTGGKHLGIDGLYKIIRRSGLERLDHFPGAGVSGSYEKDGDMNGPPLAPESLDQPMRIGLKLIQIDDDYVRRGALGGK